MFFFFFFCNRKRNKKNVFWKYKKKYRVYKGAKKTINK